MKKNKSLGKGHFCRAEFIKKTGADPGIFNREGVLLQNFLQGLLGPEFLQEKRSRFGPK